MKSDKCKLHVEELTMAFFKIMLLLYADAAMFQAVFAVES